MNTKYDGGIMGIVKIERDFVIKKTLKNTLRLWTNQEI